MKRVGILTINDNDNYGNRLQNYAVQEYLKKNNYIVETITNRKGIIGKNIVNEKIKIFIKRFFPQRKFKRITCFNRFNKNIDFSKIYIDLNNVPTNLTDKYDYFFTGSDQVWNPTFGRMSDIDFLTFASKEKRNSFSASFGINKIPEEMKEYYKDKLNNMKNISVREDSGKEIIKELTGRTDVEVLVDPTMLLSSDEWDKVARRPKQLKTDKYILNYFLGEMSEECKEEINRIAVQNECQVINILNPKDSFYETGPSEFLYLEKNAFLVCTDSFHSSVFSIIYDTPFIVFERNKKGEIPMNSRIETLLSKFHLEDRKFQGKITQQLLTANYKEAKEILEVEKEKSIQFLREALELEK